MSLGPEHHAELVRFYHGVFMSFSRRKMAKLSSHVVRKPSRWEKFMLKSWKVGCLDVNKARASTR